MKFKIPDSQEMTSFLIALLQFYEFHKEPTNCKSILEKVAHADRPA